MKVLVAVKQVAILGDEVEFTEDDRDVDPDYLDYALNELQQMVPRLRAMEVPLLRLGEAMLASWAKRGKVLTAGNGGSACDAMHLAEELSVRFMKNRRALAAVRLRRSTAAVFSL